MRVCQSNLVYLCHSTKCGPVTYIYCRVFIVSLVAMAVMAIFLVWVQALHRTNSQVTQLIYDWYVGFYGWILCNMITLDVYLKHEMYTSLLLDMPTQMPQPLHGQLVMHVSKQCLYWYVKANYMLGLCRDTWWISVTMIIPVQ